MNKYTIKIDSRLRNSNYSTSTNFVYSLGRNLGNIQRVNLTDYYIPNTSYTVNSNNNTFICNYNGGGNSSVTLTQKNYNASQMASELQTKLNLIAAVFTVTFDTQTNKFTIVSSANSFYLSFTSYPLAGRLLGFPNSQTSTATSISSTNVINLAITPLYHLYIEELPLNNLVKVVPSSFTLNNNVIPGAIASAGDADIVNNNYCLVKPIDLSQLTIKLYDMDGYIVELNGNNIYLELDLFA